MASEGPRRRTISNAFSKPRRTPSGTPWESLVLGGSQKWRTSVYYVISYGRSIYVSSRCLGARGIDSHKNSKDAILIFVALDPAHQYSDILAMDG